MKKLKFIIFILAMIFSLASCKTIFTVEMKEKLNSKDIDFQKIQYYNSAKIVLTRVLLDSESEVEDGKIKLEDGKRIQEIVLKKNTSGAMASHGKDYVSLYFEKGDDRDIRFESSRNFFRLPQISGRDSMNYEGKWFIVKYPAIPKVKVKKKDISKTIKESRKIKGVKVGQ